MPTKESNHFLVTLLVIFLGLVIVTFAGFIAPLILGILLAGLCLPLYRYFTRVLHDRENLSAFFTTLIIALVIILPSIALLTFLTKEAVQFVGGNYGEVSVSGFIDRTAHAVNTLLGIDATNFLETQLAPALRAGGLAISSQIGGFLSNALRLALNFFVMIVTIFYMLRDGKTFGRFLISLSPLKTIDELTIYRTFKETGLAVFYGNLIGALAQGTLGGLGFFLFGIPSPILWGTVMAFFSLIPFLGPYLIFLPVAAYLFLNNAGIVALWFLAYNILIVATVDNIIKSGLVSVKTHTHPLPALLSILGGLKVFGILGIIYGPLIFSTFMAILKVYLAHVRKEGVA